MAYKPVRVNAIVRERRGEAASAAQKRDLLGRAVVIAGVLISASGVVVSVANYISTERTNEARLLSDQFAAFRAARDTEDLFWKNASNDFLALFDPANQQDSSLREARLLATVDLVQGHVIPDFQEFPDVPLATRCAVIIRGHEYRTNLLNGLQEQAEGNADLIARFVARTGRRASVPLDDACAVQRQRMREEVAGAAGPDIETRDAQVDVQKVTVSPDAAPAAAPVPTASVSGAMPLGTQPLPKNPSTEELTRASADGWDIDVFWCQGDGALLNYRRAVLVSEALADLSKSGRSIASGVKLGRVRRRPAPIEYQRQEGSPAQWSLVVSDSGPGEREAALALRDSANTLLGQPLLRLGTSTGTPTRWYISMFLCSSGASPAVPDSSLTTTTR